LENGIRVNVTNVATLTAGTTYFIETDLNVPKEVKFSPEMNGFFEKLKMEEGKSEEQMKKVRDVFSEQDIEFKQLMATGDLAMTDEKLKEIGINQLGLRTAILSVIRSNV
jgi:hypothetical protein